MISNQMRNLSRCVSAVTYDQRTRIYILESSEIEKELVDIAEFNPVLKKFTRLVKKNSHNGLRNKGKEANTAEWRRIIKKKQKYRDIAKK